MKALDQFREYLLLRQRKHSKRSANYPGFEKLESVAIAFEAGLDDKAILNFASALKAEGKEVHLLGYFPLKPKELEMVPDFAYFTKNDINWIGRPKSEKVINYLHRDYGVFISLNKKTGSPIEFISASVNASFTIGLKKGPVARFDLVIESEEKPNFAKILKEAEYYLKFINKNSAKSAS